MEKVIGSNPIGPTNIMNKRELILAQKQYRFIQDKINSIKISEKGWLNLSTEEHDILDKLSARSISLRARITFLKIKCAETCRQ